jgi:uroporphyrinogen decarboxylase
VKKTERVERALAGREVDHPPLSLWYHFGVQHARGESFAQLTLEYYRCYQFDYLKVMNDYPYPFPAGVEALRTAADLRQLRPLRLEETDWAHQLRALAAIREGLAGEAHFIDTVFDPWQTLQRHLAGENMKALAASEPDALLEALDVVASNLITYCRQSLAQGSAGIFMSLAASSEIVTHSEFLTFVKPSARRVLDAVAGRALMNTAHLHGEDLFADDCLDLPVDVFSWWDRGPSGPSLASVASRVPGAVMGGIDHNIVSRSTPGFLREHVREGIRLGSGLRHLLAGGCSIPSWTYPGSIHAMVEATAHPGRQSG